VYLIVLFCNSSFDYIFSLCNHHRHCTQNQYVNTVLTALPKKLTKSVQEAVRVSSPRYVHEGIDRFEKLGLTNNLKTKWLCGPFADALTEAEGSGSTKLLRHGWEGRVLVSVSPYILDSDYLKDMLFAWHKGFFPFKLIQVKYIKVIQWPTFD
jgi:hypothetical protein